MENPSSELPEERFSKFNLVVSLTQELSYHITMEERYNGKKEGVTYD